MTDSQAFWRVKTLSEMTPDEWESLCDGCGRCCLVKLEDEDTGQIYATDIGCALLDCQSCRCVDYTNRSDRVPDCVRLSPENAKELQWLPVTCAYKLLGEGKDLPWWHPLVSGTPDTVVSAGVSVKGRVFALEDQIPLEDFPDRIKKWPLAWPKSAKSPPKGG